MQGDKKFLQHIGHRIRIAREHKEITTKKVSKDLKISLSTVNCIERGERTGKNWIKYVYYLKEMGVNINDIFTLPDKT